MNAFLKVFLNLRFNEVIHIIATEKICGNSFAGHVTVVSERLNEYWTYMPIKTLIGVNVLQTALLF